MGFSFLLDFQRKMILNVVSLNCKTSKGPRALTTVREEGDFNA